jgi:(4-(4-[2-(gamma-L-glutamylamino)ethyl]phenoxymethyl)furan-2-yl)methanamine synthase
MPPVILGLDIGGANLKAATADNRAESVPFALWKEPERLPEVLGELVAQFPEAEELAVTMTGELCDCFRTKRDGVNHILTAVLNVSRSRPVWVWTTDGAFVNSEQARKEYLKVAAANWHALATYAGGFRSHGPAVLIDVGSTTTDIIPILNGDPVPEGKTDFERLYTDELIYTGVRRTPVCAILGFNGAAELFATMLDVFLLLGAIREDPQDTDTADGRPATQEFAHARLSRMVGGDPELTTKEVTRSLAEGIAEQQLSRLVSAADKARRMVNHRAGKSNPDERLPVIASGSGEFLARQVEGTIGTSISLSLSEQLGPQLSACAPAYAVAVLAAERRP